MDDDKFLRGFFIVRVFLGFFIALAGLGMLLHGDVIVGAVLAGIGFTFFFLLWLKIRRNEEFL